MDIPNRSMRRRTSFEPEGLPPLHASSSGVQSTLGTGTGGINTPVGSHHAPSPIAMAGSTLFGSLPHGSAFGTASELPPSRASFDDIRESGGHHHAQAGSPRQVPGNVNAHSAIAMGAMGAMFASASMTMLNLLSEQNDHAQAQTPLAAGAAMAAAAAAEDDSGMGHLRGISRLSDRGSLPFSIPEGAMSPLNPAVSRITQPGIPRRASQPHLPLGGASVPLISRPPGTLMRAGSGHLTAASTAGALAGLGGLAPIAPPIELVAAIDQGTQSTRVYLFDKNQHPVASHQVPLEQIRPQPGWNEHDPFEIWRTVEECMVKALAKAQEDLGNVDVKCIGITNQRETTLVWHRISGQPLYNAVVWMDTRTRELCEKMAAELGTEYFRKKTGLPISTYFSAFKFKWLYEECDEVARAVDEGNACFGTVDSWIIYMLTGGTHGGVHVTDVSNAARTGLMDLETCQWAPELLPLFNMPEYCLPKIVSNAEIYGYVSAGAYQNVPVCGCLGDQQAAMLGQRCVRGEAKNTYGTGAFLMLHTGEHIVPSNHGLLTTVAYRLGTGATTQFCLEGAISTAGRGVSWLIDNLNFADGPKELEDLAHSVDNTGGVYFVPAFSGLLAPRWESSARGALLGLTTFSGKGHIARAMLEAICFQSREVLEAMQVDAKDAGLRQLKLLRVDGGASSNSLLMQLQADLMQVTVRRPMFQETTALGAALAAGIPIGLWTEEEVLLTHSYATTDFKPHIKRAAADERFVKWNKAVSRSYDLADLQDEF